ncbi:unnamed protein product [Dracunculus medinensis]|uniref:Fork-head domain-containing protein n=1 Tax=Dracunculus medinensis TaxID=318479 RepID=A0A0N4UEG0_DRAME|nr:unnamed protein product [Dracunculus medinensis]
MSSPSEHQNHQKLQQEHQLQNERQQRQQFQQQQQYLLNFFAAQGAALRNNLCMPNMFPFNWPMTATATVTASPSAAATVTDLPSWNPYMPYLQNGTQVHQESFEDVLKKMVQPKPSVQSSNGWSFYHLFFNLMELNFGASIEKVDIV